MALLLGRRRLNGWLPLADLRLRDEWRGRLAFCAVVDEQGAPIDLINPNRTYTPGGTIVRPGPGDIGITTSAAAAVGGSFSGVSLKTSDGAYTGNFAVVALGNFAASGSARSIIYKSGLTAANPQFYIMTNSTEAAATSSGRLMAEVTTGGTVRAIASTSTSVIDGTLRCFAYRRAAGPSLWVDGLSLAYSSSAGSMIGYAISSASGNERLGGYDSGSFGINGSTMPLILGVNDAPSDAEMECLTTDPWGTLFEDIGILVPIASGGAPTYTSTLTEPASSADSLTAALTSAAAQAESATAADSITAALTALASLAESTSVSEALAALLIAVAAQAEPVTAAELLSTGAQYTGSLTEAAASAETLSAAATLVALLTEPATPADAQAAAYPATYSVTVAELASALEVLAAVLASTDITRAPSLLGVDTRARRLALDIAQGRRRLGSLLTPR